MTDSLFKPDADALFTTTVRAFMEVGPGPDLCEWLPMCSLPVRLISPHDSTAGRFWFCRSLFPPHHSSRRQDKFWVRESELAPMPTLGLDHGRVAEIALALSRVTDAVRSAHGAMGVERAADSTAATVATPPLCKSWGCRPRRRRRGAQT